MCSTQFQAERRITLTLGAALKSPGTEQGVNEYFAPRASKIPPASGLNGNGEADLFLLIAVVDTGCGLNDEERQRLFLRFSQASPRTHVQVRQFLWTWWMIADHHV